MKDGVMINAQAYHDTSLSNLLLTEKCSTGLSFGVFLFCPGVFLSVYRSFCQLQVKLAFLRMRARLKVVRSRGFEPLTPRFVV